MKPLLATTLAICALLLLLSRATADDPTPLGHGLNLGNFLEAPQEGQWSDGRLLQADDFTRIKQAGFTFVRVPIRWSAHVKETHEYFWEMPATYTIDPAFFARVDWVVAQAEKNGLTIILDYHNDDALMKDPGPGANAVRFWFTWRQIAQHYKDAPPSVLFELLNEPNGKNMDAPHWNALLARTLTTIRATNPTRTVIVGPVHWNSIGSLKDLTLPATDTHLLVTIHYYDPFHFTHQGASWAGPGMDKFLGTTWLGTEAEKKAVTDAFDTAAQWGADHHRPIYLGEFGAYEKGPLDSRARWTNFVARTAESHGMSWSYWEYDQGFGAYDPAAQHWRAPLLKALLPDASAP
jgi:endoglucanase